MTLYKHANPKNNIGKLSGREFLVFYKDGKMWVFYPDDKEVKIVSESDDREKLERGVENGTLEKVEMELTDICSHLWNDVHYSFGDPQNPTGRRCEKCRKQEWY